MSTPVWRVGIWDLHEDLEKLREQWELIRECLEDPYLAPVAHSGISKWPCGAHAGHLVLLSLWASMGIEGNLARPDRFKEEKCSDIGEKVLTVGVIPREWATCVPEADPLAYTMAELRRLVPAAEAVWSRVENMTSLLPDCPARFPHPILGHLNCVEWIRYLAIHRGHHLKIIRDILDEVEPGLVGLEGDRPSGSL